MSIKKIAEAVGVSPATVSRVLNNPNYRSSSTEVRDRIWKTAMEMNYVPNEAARSLKRGTQMKSEKTYYVNVLVTRSDGSGLDPFFTELLRVIESEIHRQLCILAKVWYMPVFSNDRQCRTENLDRIVDEMYQDADSNCDGLIIIGKCNREALKKLGQRYKNIVSVNRNSTNYEVDEVLCDGRKIAMMAVEYLISMGHTDIGYVGECRNEARYRGYQDALDRHDIEMEPNYVIETKQTEREGFEVMKRLLEAGDCPTGIYCANDITAIGMLKCLNKYGRKYHFMPSVIASDDIEEAQYIKPMLTTVNLPKDEMGRFAIHLLLDRMRGRHKSIVRTEIEGKLMIRDSVTRVEDVGWSDYCI